MTVVLVVAIMIYFIRDQFEYSPVHRVTFLLVPLFTCYMFMKAFGWTLLKGGILVLLMLFAAWISHYQAKTTQIREEHRPVSYFQDATGHEVPIYLKRVTSQGGHGYLRGWIMVIIAQIIIEATYLHETMSTHKIWEVVWDEVLADLLTPYRFVTSSAHTSWILWALTGFTSLGYTLWLSHQFPKVSQVVFDAKDD